ncbi:ABC transporter substrate-binding protein [Granulicoccus phenolivorans]|uniref:ABC transporter substrate-binding protein n=1 Tax=Granulicoccus phenolivorans TaxID=266854 RepID=UPI00054DB30E|nr:ABC transporter substrate-binding protein [Granulicoccus phenolivorans]
MHRRTFLALGAVVPLAACGVNQNPLQGGQSSAAPGTLTVGSANFTESQVIAELYAGALAAKGVQVTVKHGIGSREVYLRALQDGSIQIAPEYTGNLLQYLDAKNPASSPTDIVQALKGVLPQGLTVLDPSQATDQDVYCVTQAYATEHKLSQLGDLAPIASTAVLGGPAELKDRPYGPPGLASIYQVTFKEFASYDSPAVKLKDLTDNKIQVATFFTTDAAIGDNGLVQLADPHQMILPQQVIPLVRQEVTARAGAAEAIDAVQKALTTEELTALNKRVDIDHASAKDAAAQYLKSKGLA